MDMRPALGPSSPTGTGPLEKSDDPVAKFDGGSGVVLVVVNAQIASIMAHLTWACPLSTSRQALGK